MSVTKLISSLLSEILTDVVFFPLVGYSTKMFDDLRTDPNFGFHVKIIKLFK